MHYRMTAAVAAAVAAVASSKEKVEKNKIL
jgi:hypothetical protein